MGVISGFPGRSLGGCAAGSLMLRAILRGCFLYGWRGFARSGVGRVEQCIKLLADFGFDALLEGAKQEAQLGLHFKLAGIHQQRAFHAGAAEIQGVLRIAFFIRAVHVKLFLGLFGPGQADVAGFGEAQVVFAVEGIGNPTA